VAAKKKDKKKTAKKKKAKTTAEEYNEDAERGELTRVMQGKKQQVCGRDRNDTGVNCKGLIYFGPKMGLMGCDTCDFWMYMTM